MPAKPTGYSVYNKAFKQRCKHNTLADLYPPLPGGKFAILYADPPWHYNGKLQFDRSSRAKDAIDLSKTIFISSAAFKYPTLKLDELKTLPVQRIACDDSLLFLWATNPHLDQAIELGKAWGFEYRTVAFVWNKMVHNPGKYNLSFCELCLLFKRGRIPTPRGARNTKQLINAPRSAHSEKPEEAARNIELMFPRQKRIELFARSERPGWTSWGMEAQTTPVKSDRGSIKALRLSA
ncbi:MAG TPA: MT-A70 family methyltransferase [Rhizomicrobium sp.]|nr:MT-A70 family methyltransferase [Rhizomicrobium sp.]